MIVVLHVPTNVQMYRQNSKKHYGVGWREHIKQSDQFRFERNVQRGRADDEILCRPSSFLREQAQLCRFHNGVGGGGITRVCPGGPRRSKPLVYGVIGLKQTSTE